jgi:hypothetical protein
MDKPSANTRVLSMAIVIAGLGLAFGVSPSSQGRDTVLFFLLLVVFIPWILEILAPYAVRAVPSLIRARSWWANRNSNPVKPIPQTPPGN